MIREDKENIYPVLCWCIEFTSIKMKVWRLKELDWHDHPYLPSAGGLHIKKVIGESHTVYSGRLFIAFKKKI